MKKLFSSKKTALLFTSIFCLICLLLCFWPGYKNGTETAGRSMLVYEIGYTYDSTALDRAAFDKAVCDTLGTKVKTGFNSSFSTGYKELVIIAEPAVELNAERLFEMLDSDYPEIGAKEGTYYNFEAPSKKTSWIIKTVLAVLLYCMILLAYSLVFAKGLRYCMAGCVTAVISVIVSSGILVILRLECGPYTLAAVIAALVISFVINNIHMNNYSVVLKGSKKNVAGAIDKAEAIGWNTTLAAVVLSVLAFTGICAGGLLTGSTSSIELAAALSVPVLVSAFFSQLLSVKIFSKEN